MAIPAAKAVSLYCRLNPLKLPSRPRGYTCIFCQQKQPTRRRFATTAKRLSAETKKSNRGPFASRLRTALRDTKVEWRPIPIGLGIAFLGAAQFYRVRQREKGRQQEGEEQEYEKGESNGESTERPIKRKRVRPSGPW